MRIINKSDVQRRKIITGSEILTQELCSIQLQTAAN